MFNGGLWGDDDGQAADFTLVATLALGVEGLARKEEDLHGPNYLMRADLLPNRHGRPATFNAGNDKAFILTTGMDVTTFDYILSGFHAEWIATPVPRDDVAFNGTSGPPERRSLSSAGALGLVLQYLNSTMPEHALQQIFAITPAVCSRYVRFGLEILQRHLRRLPECTIAWPSEEAEFAKYASMINLRHPLIDKGFCFVDGLNIPIATSLDEKTQNAYYNGWTSSHYCSCVFGFAPDGRIIFASVNAPGSWHDAAIAKGLYTKLVNHTPDGYFAIADTAFPRSQARVQGRIKAPVKKSDRLPRLLREQGRLGELDDLRKFNTQLVSARQAAEWGMRAFQGSFARLKLPLPADDHQYRQMVLEVCARLHQLRTTRVGINQIRNVYERIWRDDDDDALLYDRLGNMLFRNSMQNDRIARYYRNHPAFEDLT